MSVTHTHIHTYTHTRLGQINSLKGSSYLKVNLLGITTQDGSMENRNHSPDNINSINSKLSHSPLLLHPVTSGAGSCGSKRKFGFVSNRTK